MHTINLPFRPPSLPPYLVHIGKSSHPTQCHEPMGVSRVEEEDEHHHLSG